MESPQFRQLFSTGSERRADSEELATLDWIDGFNNRRLLERIGYVPPAEAEQAYYASHRAGDMAA